MSFRPLILSYNSYLTRFGLYILPVLGWSQIALSPGSNIQAAVDQNPAGTRFTLSGGTYRLQSIQPKDGDTFVGVPGAILNGSMVLSSWTPSGSVWTDASGFTTPGQANGYCDSSHPMCTNPEDLFYDSVPKLRVAVAAVTAGCGCWSLDYGSGKVTVGENPAGHTVEMSTARAAFWGPAKNVSISGLTIEKYAIPGQFGAVGDQYPGTNWVVANNQVRLNHGVGINLASGSQAINNFVHDNGEKGIGAGGNGILIQGNEISRNNWAGFDCGWECGGVKAAQVNQYTVQGNYVHDNFGPGLWTDVDSINVIYDKNDVRNNPGGPGIHHEISYDATISNNTVCYNNAGAGPQIFLSTSQNTKIINNNIVVSTFGDAIDLWQQNRGSGAYGVRLLAGNSVSNNQITSQTSPIPGSPIGRVSVYWDNGVTPLGNTFDYNHYHYVDPASSNYWSVATGPGYYTFASWQSTFSYDVHGTADTAVSSCPAPISAGPVTGGAAPIPAQATVSGLSCSAALLGAGVSTVCAVTLNQAAASGGAVVALSSNNGSLTVPASVTVAAGSTSQAFSATAGSVASDQTVMITATYGGASQQTSVSVIAAVVNSLSCSLTTIGQGATSLCTVILSQAAPSGGATVMLSSSSGFLTVPASVTVPAGTRSVTFPVSAGALAGNQTATVTATYNNSAQSANFSLAAPAVLSSIGCTATTLVTGATVSCTLTLSAAAPSGGATVMLSSDDTLLRVPTSVTVAAGVTGATFPATAGTIGSSQIANITATYNNSTQSIALHLAVPVLVSAISCQDATLSSGARTNCSVTLSSPAAPGGAFVTLTSNNAALSVPANITIPAGALSATFAASAGAVNTDQPAVITAAMNGVMQTAGLTLSNQMVITQSANNNSLITGSYFVRQVSLGVDNAGNLADPRSVMGTITFDGSGNYSFTGQQGNPNGSAFSQTANGGYAVDSAGMVTLDSLVRSGDKINARFGSEAIVGSTTESRNNALDLFVAIPAAGGPTNNASLRGAYWTATLEFPGGNFANARNALFSLNSNGDGTLQVIQNTGHAANYASGQAVTEQIPGAMYSMATNGSGSVIFGSASSILSGTRTIYISQDGNVLLGGTPNGYDILIGIRAPAGNVTNSNWSGAFWSAGLGKDATGVKGFTGSAVASGSGSLYWTRRLKIASSGDLDSTEVDPYSLAADGSGTAGRAQVTVGMGGNLFLGSSLNQNDRNTYEIYFGLRMPTVRSGALYVNPQGVQNAASYAPTGNPIAPGELIYLYVSGLTVTPQTATPPYPAALSGITVLINGHPAPLYSVSMTQLVAVVPYATAGPTASIVVQANGLSSNTVTVPVAATAPGVFSQLENGSGLGAIRHTDYGVVTANNPAHSGEVVLIYLTGLGAVNPPVADGAGGNADPLSLTTVTPTVTAGGMPATVLFSGMSAYPGLYQINVQLPAIPAGTTELPVTIATPNAFHDQVEIAVAP